MRLGEEVLAPKIVQRQTNCKRDKTCWERLYMYQTTSY